MKNIKIMACLGLVSCSLLTGCVGAYADEDTAPPVAEQVFNDLQSVSSSDAYHSLINSKVNSGELSEITTDPNGAKIYGSDGTIGYSTDQSILDKMTELDRAAGLID
ncbi:MAG: hypothetical protein NC543_07665 [bacterium]|nr:hypothetical protein [bacterium]MCM1375348.1 hypothetical protein [Muribaculum sp.]